MPLNGSGGAQSRIREKAPHRRMLCGAFEFVAHGNSALLVGKAEYLRTGVVHPGGVIV